MGPRVTSFRADISLAGVAPRQRFVIFSRSTHGKMTLGSESESPPSIDRDAIGSREGDVDSEPHEPRTVRAINPAKGLHRIKRDFQKRFMAEQCDQLVARLDDAIAATFKAAPVRERPYLVARTKVTLNPGGREARLERALHAQWSKEGCARHHWIGEKRFRTCRGNVRHRRCHCPTQAG